jgi:hypothetical protein
MEQKIFMATSKDVSDDEVDISYVKEIPQANDNTPPSNPLEIKPLISLTSLVFM